MYCLYRASPDFALISSAKHAVSLIDTCTEHWNDAGAPDAFFIAHENKEVLCSLLRSRDDPHECLITYVTGDLFRHHCPTVRALLELRVPEKTLASAAAPQEGCPFES